MSARSRARRRERRLIVQSIDVAPRDCACKGKCAAATLVPTEGGCAWCPSCNHIMGKAIVKGIHARAHAERRALAPPVAFADFDGVLNHQKHFNSLRAGRTILDVLIDTESFDRACVERLNTIVEATGAQLVISSSWRSHFMLVDLRAILPRHGFRGVVIGTTPHLGPARGPGRAGRRGEEVQAWLKWNRHVGAFVILDDAPMKNPLSWRLVQTSAATGLSDANVAQAIKLLRRAP